MPVQTIRRDRVYLGKVLSIETVVLEFPGGHQSRYELVKHNPSVTILPLDKDGSILFVRQYRLGAGGDLLELPAGVVEDLEDPAVCAHRELREEIGFAADHLTLLGKAYLIPGYGDELMYFFLAEGLSPAPLRPDPDELLQVVRCSIQEVNKMVDAGELQDSKSLAALMLARKKLNLL